MHVAAAVVVFDVVVAALTYRNSSNMRDGHKTKRSLHVWDGTEDWELGTGHSGLRTEDEGSAWESESYIEDDSILIMRKTHAKEKHAQVQQQCCWKTQLAA